MRKIYCWLFGVIVLLGVGCSQKFVFSATEIVPVKHTLHVIYKKNFGELTGPERVLCPELTVVEPAGTPWNYSGYDKNFPDLFEQSEVIGSIVINRDGSQERNLLKRYSGVMREINTVVSDEKGNLLEKEKSEIFSLRKNSNLNLNLNLNLNSNYIFDRVEVNSKIQESKSCLLKDLPERSYVHYWYFDEKSLIKVSFSPHMSFMVDKHDRVVSPRQQIENLSNYGLKVSMNNKCDFEVLSNISNCVFTDGKLGFNSLKLELNLGSYSIPLLGQAGKGLEKEISVIVPAGDKRVIPVYLMGRYLGEHDASKKVSGNVMFRFEAVAMKD